MHLKQTDLLVDFMEAPVRRLKPLCYGCGKPVTNIPRTGKYCGCCFDEVEALHAQMAITAKARSASQFADRCCTVFLFGVILWVLTEMLPAFFDGRFQALVGGQ